MSLSELISYLPVSEFRGLHSCTIILRLDAKTYSYARRILTYSFYAKDCSTTSDITRMRLVCKAKGYSVVQLSDMKCSSVTE
jgi:hypothetical protein